MFALAPSPSLFPLAQSDAEISAAGGIVAGVVMLLYFALIVLVIAGLWKTFVKAGKPGWAAIIPIYNAIVLLEIAKRPIWWIVLFIIPIVNFIIAILVSLDVAKNFGRGPGFGLGLAFLPFIFYLILGFGPDKYQGGASA